MERNEGTEAGNEMVGCLICELNRILARKTSSSE